MRLSEIAAIIRLELALDLRQRAAWAGLLLYSVGACYIGFLALRSGTTTPVWNALLWIILLFAAFNTLTRVFQREDAGRQLYLHTLADPRSVVIARTLYSMGLMLALALVTVAVYILLLGDQALREADVALFLLTVALGGTGFAAVLTLISAIAARAGNGVGLTAVLGLPLVLPLLLSALRASKLALDGIGLNVTGTYLLWLLLIDVLTVALAYLLFPYLWRD